jgi:hypothetical protein
MTSPCGHTTPLAYAPLLWHPLWAPGEADELSPGEIQTSRRLANPSGVVGVEHDADRVPTVRGGAEGAVGDACAATGRRVGYVSWRHHVRSAGPRRGVSINRSPRPVAVGAGSLATAAVCRSPHDGDGRRRAGSLVQAPRLDAAPAPRRPAGDLPRGLGGVPTAPARTVGQPWAARTHRLPPQTPGFDALRQPMPWCVTRKPRAGAGFGSRNYTVFRLGCEPDRHASNPPRAA